MNVKVVTLIIGPRPSQRGLSIYQLFEQAAARMPRRPALSFGGKTMSYQALVNSTEQLARWLKAMGVGPSSLVGICMDRSSEMVIAMLAVFKAGAAYLPLDPDFPPSRIEFMERDATPLAVITQAHLHAKFCFQSPHVLFLEAAKWETEADYAAATRAVRRSNLDDLAYVIYTSGSTGQLPVQKSDVVLATSTISFDISTFEIFGPLISGAHLFMAPRSVAMDGKMLAKAIETSGATILQETTSGWRLLLEAG